MASARPLIGIPADRRMVGAHPFHMVGEKYARAVLDAAGAAPLLIPSLADELGLEELLEPELVCERGDEERGRPGCIQHRARVLLPDHVERVRADHATVGGNTNERAGGCHDEGCRTVFNIINKPYRRSLPSRLLLDHRWGK